MELSDNAWVGLMIGLGIIAGFVISELMDTLVAIKRSKFKSQVAVAEADAKARIAEAEAHRVELTHMREVLFRQAEKDGMPKGETEWSSSSESPSSSS